MFYPNNEGKCANEHKIGKRIEMERRIDCELRCYHETQCQYYFFSSNSLCILYTKCNNYTKTVPFGTTYKKTGNIVKNQSLVF